MTLSEKKKQYEDMFTTPFENTDDWVAHDSDKVWEFIETSIKEAQREEAEEILSWVENDWAGRTELEFRIRHKYLQSLEDRKDGE